MTHEFDKGYWQQHWQQGNGAAMSGSAPNPYLAREIRDLVPGTALDAGCGAGAEAIWLAARGWDVTAVDISAEALAQAAARAAEGGTPDGVRWLEADLSSWQPDGRFDLVTTHYAHPAVAQLAFYERVATWVAPGGTLLIVGHLHHEGGQGQDHAQGESQGHGQGHGHGHGHGHGERHEEQRHQQEPPSEASVRAADVRALLPDAEWDVVTAEEGQRTMTVPDGREVVLHDVVVRAIRTS